MIDLIITLKQSNDEFVITETAMGREAHAQIQPDTEYLRTIRNACLMIFKRILSPWLWNPMVYRLSQLGKEFGRSSDIMHKFTDSVIKERKNQILSKPYSTEDNSSGVIERKSRMTFLDTLLKYYLDGNDIDERGIREEVDTFMFEGHDTTSSALMFATLLIGLHPEVQVLFGCPLFWS